MGIRHCPRYLTLRNRLLNEEFRRFRLRRVSVQRSHPKTTDMSEAADSAQTCRLILALLRLLMLGSYSVYDSVAPVAERELCFSDAQIGSLHAITSLPNKFLVMVGGLIVDRFGASRVELWTTAICLVAAVLTAWQGSFSTMVTGRFLFGVGSETMLLAAMLALGICFSRGGVAFTMALNLAVARGGSYMADLSPIRT